MPQISKSKINFKNYYDSHLLAVYHVTNLNSLSNLNEKNLYLVAVLETLLIDLKYDFHKFNGISNNRLNQNLNHLDEIYKSRGYSKITQEKQLSKYALLELADERKLFSDLPRVLDLKYDISFDIKYINILTYKILFELHNTYTFDISFYPDCQEIYGFINDFVLILESKEFGTTPTVLNLKNKCLNKKIKFIDYSTSDTFWVTQHKNDLTIEEIVNNMEVFKDSVVTQVLHLQHTVKDEVLCIEHIDFEYIFYTLDEFEKRTSGDFSQKGTEYPRQKIFKIDNARIPLEDYLYPIAYSCFENKGLVDECFEEMGLI